MTYIDSFRGDRAFLSNFYRSPVGDWLYVYPTVEHAFQAYKSENLQYRGEIAACSSPSSAKALGRKVQLRYDWEEVKLDVMEMWLRAKFEYPHLRAKLLATGHDTELIEGNTWNDTYWGVCRGVGENHLGKLLMKIRAELTEL